MFRQSAKGSFQASYREGNAAYWSESGHEAPNVDHAVFRFYGRILNVDFPNLRGFRLIDFGCGQGAAVKFFVDKGFDAVGVDISQTDIDVAKLRFPEIAERFVRIDPDPAKTYMYGFGSRVGVVTAFQSFYYLSDSDFEAAIEELSNSMIPGSVIFASMMTAEGHYWNRSSPGDDGLRKITIKSGRTRADDLYISFTEDEDDLCRKFSRFRPLHLGWYSAKFRSDEDGTRHLTFCGVKD